jgi:hypothetical protein
MLWLAVTPHVADAASQVVTNCNDSGAGSLRQAVHDSAPGGTVTFALSQACSSITLETTIRLSHDVTIDGPGQSNFAVSGNNAVAIFDVASGVTAKIAGLTIDRGGGNYNGGGIYNSGTLTLAESTLSLNSSSGPGGGVSNVGGTLDLTGSTVVGNSAGSYGGAIFNDSDSTLTVSDSTVANNSADNGGAILNEGTAKVIDSTLADNGATGTGGGISNYASLEVIDSTLWGNGTDENGGGIYNRGVASLAGTIVAHSIGHDCSGIIKDAGYNLEDDTSCGFSPANHSISGVKAELGPLRENGGPTLTITPAMGSPVLDQIPPTATGDGTVLCAGADQRGVPRPHDSNCDIGAVEMECDVATVATPFSLTVTTFGKPAPSMTEKGVMPKGLEFAAHKNGSATISGTPGQTGSFHFTIKATFGNQGAGHLVKQVFSLTVGRG